MRELHYETSKSAIISDCKRYRYLLTRTWDAEGPVLVYVMLNPSRADAAINDPTVLKCIAIAKSNGYGGIRVLNLFALRATDHRWLGESADPVGPDNDRHLAEQTAGMAVVCAWGSRKKFASPRMLDRPEIVLRILEKAATSISCLRLNGNDPGHPLYLPGDTKLIPYREVCHAERARTDHAELRAAKGGA